MSMPTYRPFCEECSNEIPSGWMSKLCPECDGRKLSKKTINKIKQQLPEQDAEQ